MGCRACVLRDEITTAEKHTALKHTRQSGRETDVLNPNLMFDGKESKGGCCSLGRCSLTLHDRLGIGKSLLPQIVDEDASARSQDRYNYIVI